MTYPLDTDTCVYWLRGHEAVRARLESDGAEGVTISVATLCELRYGAECSSRPTDNHQVLDNFTAGLAVWGIDADIAAAFGKIKGELRRRGQLIEDFDLLLAATAVVNDLTLVTNNSAHFARIPDLKLENWAARP